jgi:hypothetical protein
MAKGGIVTRVGELPTTLPHAAGSKMRESRQRAAALDLCFFPCAEPSCARHPAEICRVGKPRASHSNYQNRSRSVASIDCYLPAYLINSPRWRVAGSCESILMEVAGHIARSGQSMGVNWDSGLIYWKDHTPRPSERYSLSHLHPFIQCVDLPASEKYAARNVLLHISFGLHTFTRAIVLRDSDEQLYRDNREVRTFCPERYARSQDLPQIIRTLGRRRCEFARSFGRPLNYVTVETTLGRRYAVFFDLRKFTKIGANAVHLMVQSAYVIAPGKAAPSRGRITFHALLGHALRGTNPQPPP